MPRRPPTSHLGHTRSRGFTLMEIVISVVLLGMLSVVGTTMVTSSFYTSRVLTNEHLSLASARYALERMSREIREIQPNPATGYPTISVMKSGELSFTRSDLSANGTAVRFVHSAPKLQMAYPAINATLTDLALGLPTFNLSYLDSSGAAITPSNQTPPTASDLNMRFVRIDMDVQPNPSQPVLRLTTLVRLRNL